MTSLRLLCLALTLLSSVAFARSGAPQSTAPTATKSTVAPSDVQKSDARRTFDTMKTLAGSWVGQMTTVPKEAMAGGALAQISLRVTSRGNAVMHEIALTGLPDAPITMFYLDGDRLLLTHYCDAGNRPRMTGTISPDGKTMAFAFLDVTGGTQKGHMHHAVITMIDDDHHTEDWTYMMPGDKPVQAHFDLQRIRDGSGPSGQ